MKSILSQIVSTVLLLAAAAAPAFGQDITLVGDFIANQMPGSPNDFSFVGSSSSYSSLPNYASDVTPGTTNLTHFTIAPGSSADGIYSVGSDQAGGYATIETPLGYTPATPVQTAVVFHAGQGDDAPDLLTVTLSNATSFDFSDFYLYVLYSNVGVAQQDQQIDLSLSGPDIMTPLSFQYAVTDDQSSPTDARFAELHVTGAALNDTINIGFQPYDGANPVIGGLSFAQTPEPSTWAMLGLGAVTLAFLLRRKARA